MLGLLGWGWMPIPGAAEAPDRGEAAGAAVRAVPVLRVEQPADLADELEAVRRRFGVPALGAAVVRGHRLEALGVTGARKLGVAEPVTVQDKWHHGSLTKSMTALLASRMVDAGVVEWETSLAEGFKDRVTTVDPGWGGATLALLLANRGGVTGSLNPGRLWRELQEHGGTPVEQRLHLVRSLLARPPAAPPGTTNLYSNAGYAMAGALLEQLSGVPWEDLMRREVFGPLGMASAGFGVPATPRYIDQPWGHVDRDGRFEPVEPGPAADNPPAIGPGGTVHCSLTDFARYLALQLALLRGENDWLKPATRDRLHRDVEGQGYALGWGVTRRDWAGGVAYQHSGSNTQWYSNVWLAPERDWAVVVVTNAGGDRAFRATDAVVGLLVGRIPEAR